MSTEENKAKQRRVWEEIMSKGNLGVADELFATNYICHGPVRMEFKGPEDLKQLVSGFRNTFPDIHVTVVDMVAEGDKAVSCFNRPGYTQG